jgi:hypothetical protein
VSVLLVNTELAGGRGGVRCAGRARVPFVPRRQRPPGRVGCGLCLEVAPRLTPWRTDHSLRFAQIQRERLVQHALSRARWRAVDAERRRLNAEPVRHPSFEQPGVPSQMQVIVVDRRDTSCPRRGRPYGPLRVRVPSCPARSSPRRSLQADRSPPRRGRLGGSAAAQSCGQATVTGEGVSAKATRNLRRVPWIATDQFKSLATR